MITGPLSRSSIPNAARMTRLLEMPPHRGGPNGPAQLERNPTGRARRVWRSLSADGFRADRDRRKSLFFEIVSQRAPRRACHTGQTRAEDGRKVDLVTLQMAGKARGHGLHLERDRWRPYKRVMRLGKPSRSRRRRQAPSAARAGKATFPILLQPGPVEVDRDMADQADLRALVSAREIAR